MTPKSLATLIVRHFAPTGEVLDPAKGNGAFYNALKRQGLRPNWCELSKGRDFLSHSKHYDWIITNPPWSKMRDFLNHAMQYSDNVVFLATFPHFVTKARLREIHAAKFALCEVLLLPQPPLPWPPSGFQVVAMHLKRNHRKGLKINTDYL